MSPQAKFHKDLEVLWKESLGNAEVCVAILDGPVDISHSCFEGADLTEIEAARPPMNVSADSRDHGTHVTSIIFGQHGSPVQGIAPRCRGIVLPIFWPQTGGELVPASQSDLARAIVKAVDLGAHVINISGGQLSQSGESEQFLRDAVSHAEKEGALIVAAAGNDGCDCLHVPASHPTVIAVGACDLDGRPVGFSNWGSAYQQNGVLAMGQDVLGAITGGETARKTGTSFATPIVSGVAALLLSAQMQKGRHIAPSVIRHAILRSVDPCPESSSSECSRFLAGTLNILQASSRLQQTMLTQTTSETRGTNVSERSKSDQVQGADPCTGMQPQHDDESPVALTQSEDTVSPPVFHNAGADSAGERSIQLAAAATGALTPGAMLPGAPPMDRSLAPSACSCGETGPKTMVYALAELAYDFGTYARYEWYLQQMSLPNYYDPKLGQYRAFGDPRDPVAFANYLNFAWQDRPGNMISFMWMLQIGQTPIYVIETTIWNYWQLYSFFRDQIIGKTGDGKDLAERVAVPGYLNGHAQLQNGMTVPVIQADSRGLFNWSISALLKQLEKFIDPPKWPEARRLLTQFLQKLYYQLRNLGLTSQERALNTAATNVYSFLEILARQNADKLASLMVEDVKVERTPICRPDSDCWDILITMFNPAERMTEAKTVVRYTVDVSDVVPVMISAPVEWPDF